MRVHLNFVEMMPYLIGVLCISGLYLPLTTCIIAWLNVGTRILYITMYFNNGPNARRVGMLLGQLPLTLLAFIVFVIMIIVACRKDDVIKI